MHPHSSVVRKGCQSLVCKRRGEKNEINSKGWRRGDWHLDGTSLKERTVIESWSRGKRIAAAEFTIGHVVFSSDPSPHPDRVWHFSLLQCDPGVTSSFSLWRFYPLQCHLGVTSSFFSILTFFSSSVWSRCHVIFPPNDLFLLFNVIQVSRHFFPHWHFSPLQCDPGVTSFFFPLTFFSSSMWSRCHIIFFSTDIFLLFSVIR